MKFPALTQMCIYQGSAQRGWEIYLSSKLNTLQRQLVKNKVQRHLCEVISVFTS